MNYAQAADKYGTVTYNGQTVALTAQAELTNSVFPGWWGDADAPSPCGEHGRLSMDRIDDSCDECEPGGDYVSQYSAQAIDENGNTYRVTWEFDEVRGQESADEDLPWDDAHVVSVDRV